MAALNSTSHIVLLFELTSGPVPLLAFSSDAVRIYRPALKPRPPTLPMKTTRTAQYLWQKISEGLLAGLRIRCSLMDSDVYPARIVGT
jgi:hypothetical protein